MPQQDQNHLRVTRKDQAAQDARRDAGFGNALMQAMLGGAALGGFGAALGLEQLQRLLGIPDPARLFNSNSKVQEAMKRGGHDTGVGALVEMWAELECEEPPSDVRARLMWLLGETADCPVDGPGAALEPLPPAGGEGFYEFVGPADADEWRLGLEVGPRDVPEVEVEAEVKILADPQRPLFAPAPARVPPEALYRLRAPTQHANIDRSWLPLKSIVGTVDEPILSHRMAPDCLFIDGAPRLEDIDQGQNGTCWLLACLAAVVSQRPERIAEIIRVQDGVYTVELNHFDGARWVPVSLRMSGQVLSDPSAGNFSSAPSPGNKTIYSEFSADYSGEELWVRETRFCEMATWVPLLEKAFALFTERYGEHGGAPGQGEQRCENEDGFASGYDLTDGGWSAIAARILFGEDVVADSDTANEPRDLAPGDAGAKTAELRYFLRELARLSLGTPSGPMAILALSQSREDAISALPPLIDACERAPELDSDAALNEHLAELARLVKGWQSSGSASDEHALVASAEALLLVWPQLQETGRAATVLVEQLRLVVGSTTHFEAQALVTGHAYAVLDAELRDAQGRSIAISLPVENEALDRVCLLRSKVTLFNPWGDGAPEFMAGAGGVLVSDGRFEMTVDQVVRLLPRLDCAKIG